MTVCWVFETSAIFSFLSSALFPKYTIALNKYAEFEQHRAILFELTWWGVKILRFLLWVFSRNRLRFLLPFSRLNIWCRSSSLCFQINFISYLGTYFFCKPDDIFCVQSMVLEGRLLNTSKCSQDQSSRTIFRQPFRGIGHQIEVFISALEVLTFTTTPSTDFDSPKAFQSIRWEK
jgi:hypothetical protein